MMHATIDAAMTDAERRMHRRRSLEAVLGIALTVAAAALVAVPMGLAYVALVRALWRAAFG